MDRKELVNMREYQIAKASTEYYYAHKDADEFDLIDAFEAGVLWADQHPEPSRGVLLLKTDVPVEIPTGFTIEEIYPLTVVCDRYGGTYSGGRYTAWNCDPWNIPEEIDESDVPCSIFWDSYIGLVGKGATPLQAMEDLRIKLNEDLEKQKG